VFSAIFIYIKKLNKFSLNGSIFNFFILKSLHFSQSDGFGSMESDV